MVTKMAWYVLLVAPAMLFAAWLYVASAHRSETSISKSYLHFMSGFIAALSLFYAAGAALIIACGAVHMLDNPLTAWLFLLSICVGAFGFARSRIHRPSRIVLSRPVHLRTTPSL